MEAASPTRALEELRMRSWAGRRIAAPACTPAPPAAGGPRPPSAAPPPTALPQAALARSEQARLAAEARAAALQAGQAQSARELTSLQSLFRQAVEENRGLLEQLAACQARATALEAAAAVAAQAPPMRPAEPSPPLLEQPEHAQPERYPAIYTRPASGQAGSHSAAAQQACTQAAPPSMADQLSRAKRALADQLGDPPPLAQQVPEPPQPQHMTVSLPAFAVEAGPPTDPPVQRPHQGPGPVPSQPQPAPAPPAPPASDMQRVFTELQALQRRLQAAEERLQLQAAGAPQSGRIEQQHTRHPSQAGGDSRPASPGIPARPSLSPARRKDQEHRDSYQLIRELKQRRARLEAERLAALAAALAAGASSPPAAVLPASGARSAPWLFDTRDLPPSAALHQPLPRQAASGRSVGGAGGWAHQAAAHSRGAAGRAAGSRSSGTSPMAWHAANQRLPGTEGGSSRGRRRSLSAEPHRSLSRDGREPLQLSNRRRSSSRSRSEREELDRLLMAGQPTTLLASGAKAAAGGAAGRGSMGQGGKAARAGGGSWVSPLVLA